ncbi:MAG: N-acetylmuramyl-L-alanine amidase [Humibacillus sp.]|nr:N-acetylmuramyl-L-alanine amidase [Humibacillus sp.]
MPHRPAAALSLLTVVALTGALGGCSKGAATPTGAAPGSSPSASAPASTPSGPASPVTTAVPTSTAAPLTPSSTTATPSGSATKPPATTTAAPSSEPAQAAVTGTCQRTLAAYPVLSPGATGTAVRALQCFLNDADYGPVLVDGIYGKQTRAAVTKVELGFEGPAPHPGRIDAGMWVLLISRSLGAQTLTIGSSGHDVTTLQRALRAAGGQLVVDGSFGKQTASVVKQFQKSNSITVDGVVGEQTSFFLKSGGVIATH